MGKIMALLASTLALTGCGANTTKTVHHQTRATAAPRVTQTATATTAPYCNASCLAVLNAAKCGPDNEYCPPGPQPSIPILPADELGHCYYWQGQQVPECYTRVLGWYADPYYVPTITACKEDYIIDYYQPFSEFICMLNPMFQSPPPR
jgi:hypothetical protein